MNMRALIATSLMAGFLAYGQTDYRTAPVTDSKDFEIAAVFPLTGVAGNYLQFFGEMKWAGTKPVSDEAKAAIRLDDRELRELPVVTADLALKSGALFDEARPLVFEARIERARDSQVSPRVTNALSALEATWSEMVMDHASQLKDAIRPWVFRGLDEFVKVGKINVHLRQPRGPDPAITPLGVALVAALV
jgi:hypothetical protein